MNPLLLAAIPSAVSAVGSYIGQRSANKTNIRLAREAMDFSSAQASRQMDFQERMAGSAYQRAVKDMRLAGINPMLAYSQGGASSPAGAAGTGQVARVQDAVGPAVSSAMQAGRLRSELKIMKETARDASAKADISAAQAAREKARNYWLTRYGSKPGEMVLNYMMPGVGAMVGAEIDSAKSLSSLNSFNAKLAELSIPERKALADLFDKIGSGGAGARTFLPLILQMMRR